MGCNCKGKNKRSKALMQQTLRKKETESKQYLNQLNKNRGRK